MALLEVEATNFARTVRDGPLDIGRATLWKAAALVGAPIPFRWIGGPRAVREMAWRVGLVTSNLAIRDGRWVRSRLFDALDPSEKGAVSYFIGSTQAQLTAQYSLGFSHLVHVDVLMKTLGIAVGGARPDFLAVDARHRAYQATVEAKGRTHDLSRDTLDRAKAQARAHVGILVPLGGVREHVASVSWFNRAGEWQSALDDPDPAADAVEVSMEQALRTYYQPILEVSLVPGTLRRDGDIVSVSVPETSLELHLPSRLFAALSAVAADASAGMVEKAFRAAVESGVSNSPDCVVATLSREALGRAIPNDYLQPAATPLPSGMYLVERTPSGEYVWNGEAPPDMRAQYSTREQLLSALVSRSDSTVRTDVVVSEPQS